MADKDTVEVVIRVTPELLLNEEPDYTRKVLGEEVYRTALRKLDAPIHGWFDARKESRDG